jgi:hypothetical protein
MSTKSKIALTAAIILGAILGAASASVAKSASPAKNSGPPTIDIQTTCRESASALTGLIGNDNQDNYSTCMSDEQMARDRLVKDWATYPALAKTFCIQPKEYLPGYVEWQSCLEMTQDVINLRKQQAASTTAGSNASTPAGSNASRKSSNRRAGSGSKGYQSKECPIVQTAEDGSIDWVINC